MRSKATLFIDESGKSSLKEQQNNPFIMTGVIIEESELNSIEGFFRYIKRRFGIDVDKPFHSYHTYEHPTTRLTDSKLLELSRVLADFIHLIPIEIKILEVNKQEFKEALGVKSDSDFSGSKERKEIPDFPYRVMSSWLFAWFAEYLEKHNSIGQIIVDSRRGADHHLLNTLNMCKEGHVPFTITKTTKSINERLTAICFAEKNFLSGGLEITDLISYISYFRARRLVSANSHIGIDTLWNKISENTEIMKIDAEVIKRFFGLKENEVHKYLTT